MVQCFTPDHWKKLLWSRNTYSGSVVELQQQKTVYVSIYWNEKITWKTYLPENEQAVLCRAGSSSWVLLSKNQWQPGLASAFRVCNVSERQILLVRPVVSFSREGGYSFSAKNSARFVSLYSMNIFSTMTSACHLASSSVDLPFIV